MSKLLEFAKGLRDQGIPYHEIAKKAYEAGFKNSVGGVINGGNISAQLIKAYPSYRKKHTKRSIERDGAPISSDAEAMADLIWHSREFTLVQKVRLLNSLILNEK